MSEQTTLDKLSQKVGQMLRNYDELRMENMELKENIERLELDTTSKAAMITQLQEEMIAKDREVEEVVNKIESILG